MASNQGFLSPNRVDAATWGKLTSVNPNFPNIDLSIKAYKIGRNSTNDIVIQDARISGNHCIISQSERGEVILQDLSSNGTFVEGHRIGKGKSRTIHPGNKFYLLPTSKVQEKDLLGYIFSVAPCEINPMKRPRDQQPAEAPADKNKQIKAPGSPKISEAARAPQASEVPKAAKASEAPKAPETNIEEDKKQLLCFACGRCVHQCVTTEPCRHNFCGSCFSQTVGTNSICAGCFAEITELKRNKDMDERVRNFTIRNPQYTRSAEEMKDMDSKNLYHKDHVFRKEEATSDMQRQQIDQQHKEQEEAARRAQQQQREQKTNAAPSMKTRKQQSLVEEMDLEDEGPGNSNPTMTKIQKYYMLMSRFTAE